MWLFLIGQLLHGAGASPLYTLGVTFIDENVSKKMSSVYLGEWTLENNIKIFLVS
jgi:organic anion transporter 4A